MIVIKSSFKYFRKHQVQALLAILGIVLGVSMVVAIDICIESSKKAFALSMQQSFGKTSQYLISSGGDLDFNIYVELKRKYGIDFSSPVIEKDLLIQTKNNSSHKIKLLGLDPFSSKDFTLADENLIDKSKPEEFENFMLCNNCAYLSKNTADKLDIKVGDEILAQVRTGYKPIMISKIINSKLYDNLLIADISTVQGIMDMANKLSRIDLILDNKEELRQVLVDYPELELLDTIKTQDSTQRILQSFNLNLYSLSFLSLVVAVFLIYNAMSFAIVQRQVIFGIYRTLGFDRLDIFNLIIVETIIMAIIASILGIILGYGLSQILIKLISQTINDLYFVLEINKTYLPLTTVIKGFFCGVFAALMGALLPAYQASNIAPVQLTRRSQQETSFKIFYPKVLIMSVGALMLASLILYYSKANLILNFVSLALIIIALSAFSPALLKVLVSSLDYLSRNWLGPLSRISIRSISRNLSRTSIAIIALMIALSISLSLDITVNSFRQTVKDWLDSTLKADIYISAPSLSANQTTGSLSSTLINELVHNPVIMNKSEALISYRNNIVRSNLGAIKLASIDLVPQIINSFRFKQLERNWAEKFSNDDSLIVSEPFAYKYRVKLGSTIDLKTKFGYRKFKIIGIFFDYGSDQGIAMIGKKNYQALWQDYDISSLGIIIKPGLDKNKTIDYIKESLADINLRHNFNYRSNYELKTESLRIFDRTFEITKVLKLVSIVIAFIAIVSTLLALNLERKKEYAILEVLGLTQKQIGGMIMMQTMLMGVISAIFAIPIGLVEALLLIQVINLRSFGWTLNFHFDFMTVLQIFFIALIASFVASLYPAWQNKKGYLSLRND